MPNPFVHIELNSTDVPASKNFYTTLFGWELKDMPHDSVPGGNYTMIGVGQGVGGGMMKQPMPGAPSAWLPYVDVDNIKASTAKAAGLGAQVLLDSQEVMGAGWVSIFIDPQDAMIGLWQVKK